MTSLHPELERITQRIIERSRPGRQAYLDFIARERDKGVHRPPSPAATWRMALPPRARTSLPSVRARR